MNFMKIIFKLAIIILSINNLKASSLDAYVNIDQNSIGELMYAQRRIQYSAEKFQNDYDTFTLVKYNSRANQWLHKNVLVKDHIISDTPIVLNCKNLFIQGSLQAPNLTFNVENFFALNNNKERLLHPVTYDGRINTSHQIRDYDIDARGLPASLYKHYLKQINVELGLIRSTVGDVTINAQSDIVSIGSIIDGWHNVFLNSNHNIHLETAKREILYQRGFQKQISPGLFVNKTIKTRLDTFCPNSIVYSNNDLALNAENNYVFCSNWVASDHDIHIKNIQKIVKQSTSLIIGQFLQL